MNTRNGALDWIRTSGLQSRSYQAYKRKSQQRRAFGCIAQIDTANRRNPAKPWRTWAGGIFKFLKNSGQTVVRRSADPHIEGVDPCDLLCQTYL